MERINDLSRQLSKQFADKNETKKNLKMLEKQLKNLLDIFMQKQGNQDEDNAMLSKKPLGGFSCASCEKNLINLQSRPPEYYTWNKLPMRDPSDRIARVGQGFSRMLSSMKPDTAQGSRFQGHSVKPSQPQYYEEQMMDQNQMQGNPRTMSNFFPAGDRPISAQILPGIK